MAGLENALSQIQRLCSTGDPLPAHQHPRYARYINQAWWDLPTDTIIGKRRTFTSFLGSGALHTVLVDDIQLGVDLVQYHESRPVRGSIITEVIAPRPFTFQGR
ncbi:MAG TPA: hypothetical protein VLG16_02820, partial [Candidatus Saccharimonadales bacterium]|nr:hypothetical protein [Candidatus Saccharimonadales bacterium]